MEKSVRNLRMSNENLEVMLEATINHQNVATRNINGCSKKEV